MGGDDFARGCTENYRLNRRDLMASAVLGSASALLGSPRLAEAAPARPRRDRSCILVWLEGGPSALDMWDLKPHAPAELRGPFRPIRTNVPGLEICEHLPQLATLADRFCLLRSVTHPRLDHEGATHILTTGWNTWPAQTRPTYSAALTQLLNPTSPTPTPPSSGFPSAPPHTPPHPHTHTLPHRLTEARRQVESGARFVTVTDPGWDTHADHFARYEDELLPRLDRALYGLLRDLDDRGLLDSTLVLVTGEFSRTPQINGDAGRDHWPHVQTVFLAGGGLPGGAVIGASDPHGAYPADRPLPAHDLAATLYHKLGVDLTAQVTTRSGLPVPLLPEEAAPIPEIL